MSSDSPEAVTAIAALADGTRRTLYRHVVGAGHPVSREEAARAAGVAHHVARFHLDRLQEAGLLEVEFRRPSGRAGPGAGRPTKLYKPSPGEHLASVPQRHYDLAGLVFARALEAAARGVPVAEALERAAANAGRTLGTGVGGSRHVGRSRRRAALEAAIAALRSSGFEPRPAEGGFVLSNCPFRAIADEAPDVACRMNLSLVRGLLEGAGAGPASARLEPGDGRCCVVVAKEAMDRD